MVGKDRMGMARMNHAIETLSDSASGPACIGRYSCWVHLHIAKEPKLALVKHTLLDFLPAPHKAHQDRHEACAPEAQHRDTKERIESRGGTKVDAGEGALDDGLQDEAVYWHFELT